jgi:hypothetical protein
MEMMVARRAEDGTGSMQATGGVQGWSSAAPYASLVVFAVGGILRAAQFNAWALEHGLRFKPMVGKWQGITERSFIVFEADLARILPWVRDEERLMLLGPAYRNGTLYGHRRAWLVDPKGMEEDEYLGLYTHAGLDTSGDWTYDPATDMYWHIEPGTGVDPASDEIAFALTHPGLGEPKPMKPETPSKGPRGYHDGWTVRDPTGLAIGSFATEDEAAAFIGKLPDQDRVYNGDYSLDPPSETWPIDPNSPAGESRSALVARGYYSKAG